jgi:hypothetical protein
MMHPHPHLPHHPHVDLRALGRDAVIATEVVLAAVVLGGAIERHTFFGSSDASAPALPSTSAAPVAAEVASGTVVAAMPTIELVSGADGVAARAHLPAGGVGHVYLVAAGGETVGAAVADQPTLRFERLPAGEYHLVLEREGPIEQVPGAALSSSVAVRTPSFVVPVDGVVTVSVVDAY